MKKLILKNSVLFLALTGIAIVIYVMSSSLAPTSTAKEIGDSRRVFTDPLLNNGEYKFLIIPAEKYHKYLYVRDFDGSEKIFRFMFWNNQYHLPEPTHERPIFPCKLLSLSDDEGSLINIESISCLSSPMDAKNYSWDFSGKNLGCYLPNLIEHEFTRKYEFLTISKISNLDNVKPDWSRCKTNSPP